VAHDKFFASNQTNSQGMPPIRFLRIRYVWPLTALAACACAVFSSAVHAKPRTTAAPANADVIVQAEAAFERRDRDRLATLRHAALAASHPLAMWADYWELANRLRTARQSELDAFYARWPNTYVENQLRSDWILELGKRREWSRVAAELSQLRAIEDREVACYGLLIRHQAGEDVAAAARELWFAQREADHGCAQLAAALYQAGRFTRDDLWARARLAAEQGRRFVAQHALGLMGSSAEMQARQAFLQPMRLLSQRSTTPSRQEAELVALAIMRLAARSPRAAAAHLSDKRSAHLPLAAAASAWAMVAKQAAMDLDPQAVAWYERSAAIPGAGRLDLTDDTWEWKVRAALRAEDAPQRWQMIADAVDAMSPAQREEPSWMYWKARALKAMAPADAAGETQRKAADALMLRVTGHLHYYGRLAAEELGRPVSLPERPAPLTDAERAEAANHPGLSRALALLELKLREEAWLEWNHALHGMNDRALLAAAQRACDAEVWNRCMSTSERTRGLVDMQQRFPMPFRDHVEGASREADVDMAYIYGVMRQESHFNVGVRSIAGAAGLMQVMPHTARWTAMKFRIPYKPDRIMDPATNVRLGARYLKTVLDAFNGSQAHAAAAYNAGPNRPRRWRPGMPDIAAWTEIIPLDETRDYVKNVVANAAYYQAMLGNAAQKTRIADAVSR
jgi:soluble lytic murein transglycosylase